MPENPVNGLGDVHETIVESRAELAAERAADGPVSSPDAIPDSPEPPEGAPQPFLRTPRFSAEGLLLNPHECEISREGIVTGKVL